MDAKSQKLKNTRIEKLVGKVEDRKSFLLDLSDHLGNSYHTLQNNWFRVWRVPAAKQDAVISFTETYLKTQKKRSK